MRSFSLLLRLLFAGVAMVLLGDPAERPSFAEAPGKSTIPLEESKDRFGDPLPRYAWGRLGTVRWRHGEVVNSVAFHPEGKTLISTAGKGPAQIWDAATGKELRRLEGHRGNVLAITFDRKGERVAGVTFDGLPGEVARGYLLLWDYRTGKRLWMQRAEETLYSVAFSPDGATLATGGWLDNTYLWDTKTGKIHARFRYDQPKAENKDLAPHGIISFSRDGRLLACGGMNGKGHVWNVASGEKVWGLDTEDRNPQVIVFSPDGKRLASVGSKDRLALWDIASRKQVGTIPVSSSGFQFSPDGKLLAVGEEDHVLGFWDVSTRKKIRTVKWIYLPGFSDLACIPPIAFSPDGKRLAWGGLDHRVHLLDVATGEECQISRGPHAPIESLAYSPDGQILALGSQAHGGYDPTVYLWSLAPLKVVKTYTEKTPLWSLAFSTDGRTLAVGTNGLHLWNPVTGKSTHLHQHEDGLGWINAVVFSPDGTRLIVGDQTETVRLWDARTGQESHRFRGSADIYALALSPNGRLLAAGDEKSSVYIWDLTSKKEVAHFAAHQGWIRATTFSPDGKTLVTGGEGKTLCVWEMASRKLCLQLNCDDEVNCLAFSRDGRFLASGGKDMAVSLWDLATGKRVARLTGHQGAVAALAFSPDGKTLATASKDTTALLWHWQEPLPRRDKPSTPLSPRDLQRYWKDLASQDAKTAYRAIWTLAAAPEQAVSLIREHLHPISAPDARRIARLMADLDSNDFSVREQATRELAILGELAEPALRKAVESKASTESRRRAKELLDRLGGPVTSPEKLRSLRALIVLDQSRTSESVAFLKRLANGAAGARLTQEAQTVLDRLEKGKGTR